MPPSSLQVAVQVNDRSHGRTQLAMLRTHWKDMLFFDSVMHREIMAELFCSGNELPNRHSAGPLVLGTSLIEHLPGSAEMRVEVIHAFCQAIIYLEVSR